MVSVVVDWKIVGTIEEFYELILPQLIAPNWHGHTLDALNDSLVNGDINGLEPPFTIESQNSDSICRSLKPFQLAVLDIFKLASKEREIGLIEK